jgi:hypothetical protein
MIEGRRPATLHHLFAPELIVRGSTAQRFEQAGEQHS